jgi:hypothetical protein
MKITSGVLALLAAWLGASAVVAAQPAPAVRELANLLEGRKLDSFATRVPGTTDRFVAALYIPGQQMIVVAGRYGSPALVREKILLGRYLDAYRDLYGASDPASRSIVEDLRADGLRAVPGRDEPSDAYTGPTGSLITFDGEWKQHKLSHDAYLEAFAKANADYATNVGVLVSALKAGPETTADTTASALPHP